MLTTERAVAEVVVKRLGAAWFIGVLLVSFGALFILTTMYGPDMREQLLKNADHALIFINFVVLLLVTVIAATEIPYDITERVLLSVLAKPIRRYQYVVGKFIGVAGVGVFYVTICLAFSMLLLFCMGYSPDGLFLQSAGAIFLRVLVAAGFVILLSSCFTEVPTIGGSIAFCLFSLGINMAAMALMKSGLPLGAKLAVSPLLYAVPSLHTLSAPPTALSDFLAGRTRDLDLIDSPSVDAMFETTLQSLPISALYATAYAFLFLSLAVLFFYRSERVE